MSNAGEAELIARTRHPATRASLARQLAVAGVASGGTVLVHSSLRALGWVAGGAVALIQAVQDAVGPTGTVAMPAHSMQLTDPAGWTSPPVPTDWVGAIRADMPAYDAATTPTRSIGTVAELFRTWPGAERSAHPHTSFAAVGRHAGWIVADHALASPLGEGSPLARLHELDALVLLLGVGFDVCTMLHLAERRAWPDRSRVAEGAPLIVAGARAWVACAMEPIGDTDPFAAAGQRLLDHGLVRSFDIGHGRGMAMSSRQLVDETARLWRDQGRVGNR